MPQAEKLRVLIVDDSAVVRQAMTDIVSSHPDMEVMATAKDPFEAAERIRCEVPDVITLDVEMPRMDGITFLRRLMSQRPVPVVMCSSVIGEGTKALVDVMEAGAAEMVKKPSFGTKQFLEESTIQIQDKILAASKARLRNSPSARSARSQAGTAPRPATRTATALKVPGLVAIGASTGGTEALQSVLTQVRGDTPPILIVQHMPEHFTRAFAARLDSACQISVQEARDGQIVQRGHAYIAPGNLHMAVKRSYAGYAVSVYDGPLVSRHRPSVDVLFNSVADVAGRDAVGVIMTGMGSDGAQGLLAMQKSGAATVGQDEHSSVVYGMARAARELGGVATELPLTEIPGFLGLTA